MCHHAIARCRHFPKQEGPMSIPFCLPAMKKNEGDGVKRVPGCRENHPVAAHHGQFKGKRNENVRQKKAKGRKKEGWFLSFVFCSLVGCLCKRSFACILVFFAVGCWLDFACV